MALSIGPFFRCIENFRVRHRGHLDEFSLGAIAYHVFSGVSPAANAVELSEKLRETKGLRISSVLNGANECLQEIVRYATHPVVPDRMGSAADFLGLLDEVEHELTSPEPDTIDDPTRAQIGDLLPGGYTVVRRLGQGACSLALLVERNGQYFILKAANDPQHNPRLKDEADLLGKQEMRHPCIVDLIAPIEIGRHYGFLMRPVFADRDKRLIETQRFMQNRPQGTKTLCWLPSFFSTEAQKDLGTLVILEHILTGERFGQFSNHLSPQDCQSAKAVLESQRSQLRQRVQNHLDAAYAGWMR